MYENDSRLYSSSVDVRTVKPDLMINGEIRLDSVFENVDGRRII